MADSRGGCVFCKVVAGEEHAVYRDEHVVAFLDHAPVIPGHTLVVPTKHYDTLEDLPDAELGTLFGLVKRVSRAFATALGAEGTLVLSNVRISQSVPHAHVHAIPRRKGDGLFSPGRRLWMRRKYEPGVAEEIAQKLSAALAS